MRLSVGKGNKNKGNKKLKDKTEKLQTNLSRDSFSSKSRNIQSCCPCQKEIEIIPGFATLTVVSGGTHPVQQ